MENWEWPANISKDEWGRRGWSWFHNMAIDYPEDPTLADGRRAFRRIWNFVTHIPCPKCRDHAMAYVCQNPPNLADSEALQIWVFNFHNSVNVRLKKPAITYEKYQELYADELCWAGLKCDIMTM